MDLDDVPVIGKVKRTIDSIVINFVLLGVICLILAIVIIFFPQVLVFLVSALLLVMAIIFFNIAYRINHQKNKYIDFLK